MKIIIAGSRNFNDYKTLELYCDQVLENMINLATKNNLKVKVKYV